MKLKEMHLTDFKGVKAATYRFGDRTRIKAANGLGKTTIATAWYWLWADKDYELHSNPNIRPENVEECIPRVELVLEIDGAEIVAAKQQKRTVSKPDNRGISKVTLTNTYEVNSVPKTERDFKAYFEDYGIRFDKFLPLSHPEVFVGQKANDMRKLLFSMAESKTDCDVAGILSNCGDVAELLQKYKAEEIEAMSKASKKKAVEQVDAIPNQIIGLEKAKVDVDVAKQELARAELKRKIAEVEKKISNAGAAVSALQSEEMQLQSDMSSIMQTMNRELQSKCRELEGEESEVDRILSDLNRKVVVTEKQISVNLIGIDSAELKRKALGEQYKAELARTFDETPYLFDESKWLFDENSTVCSMCGQTLPADQIEQLRADFETRKHKSRQDAECKENKAKRRFESDQKAKIALIKASGFAQKKIIDDCTAENAELEKKIAAWKSESEKALQEQKDIEKQLSELPTEADYMTNEEYAAKRSRITEIERKIASLKDSSSVKESLENERNTLSVELDKVKEIIAQASNNVRIDEQIEALQEKQRDYEQAKADAEKILYQLSLVSKKKNEVLSEEINSKFGIVKWVLFDYLKNGEYKEVCIPTVDGFRFGESTNTGREIIAKLDICNSLQQFYGTEYPVFLDGAESLNDFNLPKLDCQLITLNVTADKELKVEVE